jgi:hypothetical protein
MIDLRTEELITLGQGTKLLPPARGGKKTHVSTLFRWILDGAKAPDGSIVRLEAVRLPRGWMTSRAAIERFIHALTPDLSGARPKPPRSPAARQRALKRADRELARLGI